MNTTTIKLNAPGEALYKTALDLFDQGFHADGVKALRESSEAGFVPAMSLLGAQLLSGRGAAPDPVGGIRLIMAAAKKGGGYANAMAAALLASGVSGKPDWPAALDHLQRAAEGGFRPAQDQLRLLVGRNLDDWRGLRAAVDIKAWRDPPAPKPLSEDPRVLVAAQVLPAAVCVALIAQAKQRLQPAQVYDEVTGGPTANDTRRNSAAEFSLADMDPLLLAVRERLAALAALPVAHLQGTQVLHYAVGEGFTPHFDFLDPALEGPAQDIAQRGQRVATVLVYLNDDLEGGETEFPELGIRHRGKRGDALVFYNLDPRGQPDRRTLHAGLPPTSGEKWLLSQWIRDRAPPGVGDPRLVEALGG